MAATRPNLDKYSTALSRTSATAVQTAVQRLIAHEVGAALQRDGPYLVRGTEHIPVRVKQTNLQTQEDLVLVRRNFRVTVELYIDGVDLADLQRVRF